MRYIENSPIFMVDRVRTPVLMLHNDADDAVPWYQGIEFYLALRRLDAVLRSLSERRSDARLDARRATAPGQERRRRAYRGRAFRSIDAGHALLALTGGVD